MTTTQQKWRGIKFKDFIKLQRGFDLPKQDRAEGKYPVVASTSITGYHDQYKVEPPCVTTGRSGALGEVLYVKEKCWPLNTVLWVKDFKGNDPYFVYSLLKTLHLEQYNSGAGVPTLNRNHLDQIEIEIPPIENQKNLSSVLSTYDDLIENNTRRIQLLEQMAQAIYSKWFTHEGDVPKGWKILKLRDCLKYYVGGGWGNEEKSDDFTIPAYVIRGTDIPKIATGNVSECPLRFHKQSNFESRRAEALDIVFEVSGGSKGQPVGRQYLVTEGLLNQFNEPVIFASFCKLVRVNQEVVSPYQITLLFEDLYRSGKIMKYQTQSTGITNFKFEHFIDDVDVLVPTPKESSEFVSICKPIFSAVQEIGAMNSNLRNQRDLLLPKLVTGEIKV